MSLLIGSFTFLLALTVLTVLFANSSLTRIMMDFNHQLLLQDLLVPIMFVILYILWGAWFSKLQGLPIWG